MNIPCAHAWFHTSLAAKSLPPLNLGNQTPRVTFSTRFSPVTACGCSGDGRREQGCLCLHICQELQVCCHSWAARGGSAQGQVSTQRVLFSLGFHSMSFHAAIPSLAKPGLFVTPLLLGMVSDNPRALGSVRSLLWEPKSRVVQLVPSPAGAKTEIPGCPTFICHCSGDCAVTVCCLLNGCKMKISATLWCFEPSACWSCSWSRSCFALLGFSCRNLTKDLHWEILGIFYLV